MDSPVGAPAEPEPELPELDTPPRSGVFVDHDAEPLTPEQIELGNALGEVIAIDDDSDTGGAL